MKKTLIYIISVIGLFSCDLDEVPVSEVSKEPVFSTENGLELYANSFYEILPTPSAAHQADNMCDYAARALVPNFILADAYGPQQSDGWDWEKLRNINYFIQNCTDPRVSESVRMNYIGLARFFRAWFYFDKVKRFGDVPWINKAMEVDDPDLYAARDSRTLVMDSVLADLDFACEHITLTSDQTSSLITKYVAQAFKSRVCLFEGTFRKYHTEYGLKESANAWLNEAVKAAEDVIANSGFKLYTANGTTKSYRDLFISVKPVTTEVMLAADFETREAYRIVELEERCRKQQLNEGWFPTLDDVPFKAVSMTPYQIMQCETIVSSVPGERKAEAVRNTLKSDEVIGI